MPGSRREIWYSLCVLGVMIGGEKVTKEELVIDGVEEGVFHEELGSLIFGNAVNDVSKMVDDSESIVVESLRRRRRLDEETNGTSAIIDFSAFIDTCAELGFTSNDECAAAFDEELTDAAESGELAERINYWANYYGLDPIGGVTPQENVTTWVFAPSAAPTDTPSFDAFPSLFPTPSPTSSPKPTASFAPTSTPMPSSSHEPTALEDAETDGPTTTPSTANPTPAPFDPISTLPPITTPSTKKKNNNNNQATLIIILVIVALLLLCCCCVGYFCYLRQQERKATERKDSWDIDTMLTDDQDNLPESEDVVATADEDGSSHVVVVEGEESQLVPVQAEEEEQQDPQYLQKITQAAEL